MGHPILRKKIFRANLGNETISAKVRWSVIRANFTISSMTIDGKSIE